jgi:hypothetical protein
MKKRKKRNKKMRIGRYPFTIHADPLQESTAYPTHTHGLTEIGMPEFIMDPLSFGGEGNCSLINHSYRYFKKNKKDLQTVLNGKTLKFPINKISPKWKNAPIYTICFRRVPNTFEAVKLAYPAGVLPEMKFIQIWIDGDDYALTDEYYRGGVKPPSKFLF